MDEIVRQALAKWPNVPHCYGWLALDARGGWRMRDEQAQAQNSAGERISNATLIRFINRNYMHDDKGCWYFQNGPQRVYVSLEATPYIARTDPQHGFVLHTGEPLAEIDAVWLTDDGQMILKSVDRVAQLDDRDMAQCLAHLRLDGGVIGDEQLLEWLKRQPDHQGNLTILQGNRELPVQYIRRQEMPALFGFVPQPQQQPGVSC